MPPSAMGYVPQHQGLYHQTQNIPSSAISTMGYISQQQQFPKQNQSSFTQPPMLSSTMGYVSQQQQLPHPNQIPFTQPPMYYSASPNVHFPPANQNDSKAKDDLFQDLLPQNLLGQRK
jgi:hypothetical protein